MGKVLLGLLLLALVAFATFAWTLTPATIDLALSTPQFVAAKPRPPATLRISLLDTGYMESREIFSYRGGKLSNVFQSGMAPLLIDHPEGRFLLDTGFGREVDAHIAVAPALVRNLASYQVGEPAVDQLIAAGFGPETINGVLVTHSHWDHVSGIPDFPAAAVWLPTDELRFVRGEAEMSKLMRSFEWPRYTVFPFDGEPYLGFARSHDLFADGSVVIVPVGGHTPGSIAVFINLPSGKRYVFVGDLVWAAEGISKPAERPWLARRVVDHDQQKVREAIVHFHKLSQFDPTLVIVPAHDRRVHQSLAQFPDFEN